MLTRNRCLSVATIGLKNTISVQRFGAASSIKSPFSGIADSVPTLSSYEEVQIPVPWGHIAGKWWGQKDVTPVIGLHGFEDNAGTFDRLAPMLHIPAFLALDAPGHGKSSHYPNGMVYTFVDFIITLRRVVKHYGWQKFSIIGHSFGSTMGHVYGALYQNDIDRFVSLDCARTLMATGGANGIIGTELLRRISEKSLKADSDISRQPPAYSREEMVQAYCKSSLNSILEDFAGPIIERGARIHPTKPNHYYFTRDQKLRTSEFNRPCLDTLKETAKNLKCHYMTILASQGFVNVSKGLLPEKKFSQFEDMIKETAASYQKIVVTGTHHVHLNHPEKVAPHINKFFTQ